MDKSAIKSQLEEASALSRLADSEEFQRHLKPILEAATVNKWIDPSTFPDKEKFFEAYEYNRAKASVYSDLIAFLQSQKARAEKLSEKVKSGRKEYGIK